MKQLIKYYLISISILSPPLSNEIIQHISMKLSYVRFKYDPMPVNVKRFIFSKYNIQYTSMNCSCVQFIHNLMHVNVERFLFSKYNIQHITMNF